MTASEADGFRTREETMRPRSLGMLRPWRRIQYLFRKMGGSAGAGDGKLPLESSIARENFRWSKCLVCGVSTVLPGIIAAK
jgi:hypothetical protein